MDKEVLEVLLKRCARESQIWKVLEMDARSALPKGENYSSKILRLRVKVLLGSGRTAWRSMIVKQIHNDEGSEDWSRNNALAIVEVHIYAHIHKEMTYLMEEQGDTEDSIWCDFIHYDKTMCALYLEDLKAAGYIQVPRQEGLDLDHALLALRGLARYHGMGKVLEERGIVNKDNYKPLPTISQKWFIKAMLYSGIQNASRAIKQYWPSQWAEIAEKMEKVELEPFTDRMISLSKPLASEFTVLNHGDCWSNNIMFKYDWRARPFAAKFVDYQVPHYNSPCADLTNFIYLSIQPPIRRQNYNLLLTTYHDCLVSTLDRFGYRGIKPSLQDITSAMDRFSIYALALFVFGYPCVTCSSTDAIDMDKIMMSGGKSGFNSEIFNEPGMRERMGADVIELAEKHLPIV